MGLLYLCSKEFTCQCRRCKRCEVNLSVGKIPWRKWQPTSVFLLGEFYDRGASQAIVHGVAKSTTWLSQWAPHTKLSFNYWSFAWFGCYQNRFVYSAVAKYISQLRVKCCMKSHGILVSWASNFTPVTRILLIKLKRTEKPNLNLTGTLWSNAWCFRINMNWIKSKCKPIYNYFGI